MIFLPGLVIAQTVKDHNEFPLMGTRFGITLILEDSQLDSTPVFYELVKSELIRIEELISSWSQNSQTSKINRNAGIQPVKVDSELYGLIKRGNQISKITSGAFDLSYAGLLKIWKFDGSLKEVPDSSLVKASKRLVDHSKIQLNDAEASVFLLEKGMRIGFGGMGKGYAANKARDLLMDLGIRSGAIDAGGDLITWGKNEDGDPWKVGIRKPGTSEEPIGFLNVTEMAVVTSGNYERFAEIDGHRYSHIIDPRTGWPSQGLKSVTVVCKDAELADALATAVFVLGAEVGLDLIEQMPGIDCVIIDDSDHIFTTKGIVLLRD